MITPKSIDVDLGKITLSQKSITMGQVEVSGQKKCTLITSKKKL
jgi:hypothetical protein